MELLTFPLLTYYLLIISVICVYGLHRYWMVWLFIRSYRKLNAAKPENQFTILPRVTVQLPMFNERHVAERVIEAACAIDYPPELLQVQVLDDSTDESAEIARLCCERMTARGHDVQYVHRTSREGYKAGALADGMKTVTGEFIAIFDADFVPPVNLLHDTIHFFNEKNVGMVQTRWSHLNRDDSLLTRIQAMYLDGHFVVEQTARAGSGRWFNFNGTAGIWRRTCIDDAGGWQHDTLTEDTDLSYRAQMRDWQFLYVPAVCCPAEIPPTVSAFMTQQHRWNKGLIQTAIKMLPSIFRSDAPLMTKIEAFFHLTCPIVHFVILLLVLLISPAMWLAPPLPALHPLLGLMLGSVFLLLGALAACAFYITSQIATKRPLIQTLIHLPVLMAIGVGISVINSKAVLEAVFRRQSPFVRTPKYNGAVVSDADPVLKTQKRRFHLPTGAIEMGLGVLMLSCFAVAFTKPFALVGAPFLLMFACGFLGIGWPTLRHSIRSKTASVDGN